MPDFSSALWNKPTAADSDPVTRSLRFNYADDPYLEMDCSGSTPSYGTIAVWVKLGDTELSGQIKTLFRIEDASDGWNILQCYIDGDQKLNLNIYTSSSDYVTWESDQVFRDPSAWMHLAFVFDSSASSSTISASSDSKVRIYVNGSLVTGGTEASTGTHPLSTDTFNLPGGDQDNFEIGRNGANSGSHEWDGLMADFYYIEGNAVSSPVGHLIESTGYNSYKPKAFNMSSYSGNSFHLKFEETGVGTGDSDTVGADSSGQDNHFDSIGIVASDVLMDTPTKNYAVLNPLVRNNGTLSDGNLKFVATASNPGTAVSTLGMSGGDGKFLCEWYYDGYINWPVGISDGGEEDYASYRGIGFWGSGAIYEAASATQTELTAASSGDIVGVAVDLSGSNRSVQFYINGSTVGSAETIPSSWDHVFFTAGNYVSGHTFFGNFGQDPTFQGNHSTSESEFAYPITGYGALTASAYADPTVKAHENFNTVLYSGDGNTDRSISGVGFQPDLTWIKNRDTTGTWHVLHDSLRGASDVLFPNESNDEDDYEVYFGPFQSDGFKIAPTTVGSAYNTSGDRYVAWNWLSSTSAESGNVSHNSSAGWSIVKWVGGSTTGGDYQEVTHGLGGTPEMIIAKNRTSNASSYTNGDWIVYHKDVPAGYVYPQFLLFNEPYMPVEGGFQEESAPISNVGSSSFRAYNEGGNYVDNWLNYGGGGGSSDDYIAYTFRSVDGVCKVGSYTGNGVDDGPTVHCGLRPAFVLFKNISETGWWTMVDNKRSPENIVDQSLWTNSPIDEDTYESMDFIASGFKLRNAANGYNNSDKKYIFLAMAESPLKYANAR